MFKYYRFLAIVARDKLGEWHNLLESKLKKYGVDRIVYEYRRTLQSGETDFVIRLLDRNNKTMGRFHIENFKCRKLKVEYIEYESDKQIDNNAFEKEYIDIMCEMFKEFNYKDVYLKFVEAEAENNETIIN